MASPNAPQATSAHPLTPPAEPSPAQAAPAQSSAAVAQPLISLKDDGQSKRPRDGRLIHLVLSSMGVSAYQERVPLQLLDFAYRYTSSVLSDSLHIQAEGYDTAGDGVGAGSTKTGRAKIAAEDRDGVSLASMRLAIGSRAAYQFQGTLPKEFLMGLASERNRIGLGVVTSREGTTVGGVKLPHEKYCLTGVGWGVRDEWDSEGEEDVDAGVRGGAQAGESGEDAAMEDEDADGMEGIFGAEDDADQEMQDG